MQDTYYRKGEWVPEGRPVVCLLPEGQVRVRFFVPVADDEPLRAGRRVRVEPLDGTDPVAAVGGSGA